MKRHDHHKLLIQLAQASHTTSHSRIHVQKVYFHIDIIAMASCISMHEITHIRIAQNCDLAVQGLGALLSSNLEETLYKSPY